MAYCILRAEKHKTWGTVGAAYQHALRARETPNADAARTPGNITLGATSSADAIAYTRKRMTQLTCQPRHKSGKNAPVICIEYFVGMSPDAAIAADKAKAEAYLQDALRWLAKRHGKRNMVGAQVHWDETTPHMSVFVVPEIGGKLNAKAFLGGRQLLADMQTEFAGQVGAKHGLQRGKERSQAKHVDVATWYATVKERDELRAEVQQLRGDLQRLQLTVESLEEAVRPAVRADAGRRFAAKLAAAKQPKPPTPRSP